MREKILPSPYFSHQNEGPTPWTTIYNHVTIDRHGPHAIIMADPLRMPLKAMPQAGRNASLTSRY
jgi:hypothetical protein